MNAYTGLGIITAIVATGMSSTTGFIVGALIATGLGWVGIRKERDR